MKKIPKDTNWHYLKWLAIAIASILLLGVVINLDRSLSVMSNIFNVMTPLFLGFFMAIILNIPVVILEYKIFGRLTRRNGKVWSKIKRAISISISLTCLCAFATVLVLFIFPQLKENGRVLIEGLPDLLEELTEFLQVAIEKFNIPIDDPESVVIDMNTLTSIATSFLGDNFDDIFKNTINTAISLFSSIWNVILGFILAIYIVSCKEDLSKLLAGFVYSAFSTERAKSILSITRLSKQAFEGFIMGQCIESLLIGSLTFIGMLIFRFDNALLVSCIISITAFIPIFGAVAGAIIGALIILISTGIKEAILFLIFILILQQVESNFLYPRIMGHQIGLPSLWVLVAVILGGELFGIPGIIISVPLCSVLYTLLHEWILKRLREKRLCKLHSSHIPSNPQPLTEEEFLEEIEEKPKKKEKPKKSKTKITQKKKSDKKNKKSK